MTPRISSPIKKEVYFFVRAESNYISFGSKASVYLLVPEKADGTLAAMGVNFQKRPRLFSVEVEVVTNEQHYPQLIYTFFPLPDEQRLAQAKKNLEQIPVEVKT